MDLLEEKRSLTLKFTVPVFLKCLCANTCLWGILIDGYCRSSWAFRVNNELYVELNCSLKRKKIVSRYAWEESLWRMDTCMCMRANLLQLCPTPCNPMDCSLLGSLLGSSVEILQARVLEWVAMCSSRGSSQPRDQTHISYVSSCSLRW